MTDSSIPVATVGDNKPPLSAEHAATITELEIELSAWLTGADITEQPQADELGVLLGKMDAAKRAAEAALKGERKPHQDAVTALGVEYKPALESAERCLTAGKLALGRWRQHLEAEAARRAAELRAEQKRLEDEARAAREAAGTDIEAAAAAAELAEQSVTHRIAAAVVAKKPVGSAKLGGRSLRMVKRHAAHVEDPDAAIEWAWGQNWQSVWQALKPAIERLAEDAAKTANRPVGEWQLGNGAIVVTTTEEAV